jgi:hypothetical protein
VALWRATVDIVDSAMVGCSPSPSTPPPHRRRCSLGRRGYYRESTILSGHLAGGSCPLPPPYLIAREALPTPPSSLRLLVASRSLSLLAGGGV